MTYTHRCLFSIELLNYPDVCDSEHPMENIGIKKMNKLRIASDLYDLAFEVKFQQLKRRNPNLNHEEIRLLAIKKIHEACEG